MRADHIVRCVIPLLSALSGGCWRQATPISFERSEFSAGELAMFVVIADLNDDDYPDLAVANGRSDDVSILLNRGDGSFAEPVNYQAGISSMAVAAGDLDGDGDPDLVVANSGLRETDGNVAILTNHGDGTFGEPTTYDTGAGPYSVAIGDLDGDKDLDLAVAALYGPGVSILLNKGDGTFEEEVVYEVDGLAPRCVVAADMDADGDLDLAVVTDGRMQVEGRVSILLNTGAGAFLDGESYAQVGGPMSVAVGDVNGDDHQDLAVVGIFSNGVYILFGHGDGTFADAEPFLVGDSPVHVAMGDLDGDGDADLAVANALDDQLSVLLNKGDGTFAPFAAYEAGPGPASVAVGDLDRDGDLDLAVSNQDGDAVSILLNQSRSP